MCFGRMDLMSLADIKHVIGVQSDWVVWVKCCVLEKKS